MKIFKHKHFEQKISDLKSELEKFKSDNEKLSIRLIKFLFMGKKTQRRRLPEDRENNLVKNFQPRTDKQRFFVDGTSLCLRK